MIKYAIYKCKFVKSPEGKSLYNEEGESAQDCAQDIFARLFGGGKLNMYKTLGDGTVTVYPNDVLRTRGGVTVMSVCNVKSVTMYKHYKEIKDESNPWCTVVIDNRRDVAQIAIERSEAFDYKPDVVRNLLLDTFRQYMKYYGVDVELAAKVSRAKFWDVVEEQCVRNKDTVTKVVIEIPNTKKAEAIDTSAEMGRKLDVLSSLVCAADAAKGSLRFDARKDGALKFDQTVEDMVQLVTMSCNNGYNITVHFKKMGEYRCNDDIRAMRSMKEGVTDDFVNGQTVMGAGADDNTYALMQWLDDVRETTKEYEDAKPVAKRRKKNC